MLLTVLDYAGVFVFAITGCLVAARRRVDIVGFIWLAVVTGIGGGTVRDLVLDRPVFWLDRPIYLYLCIAAALLLFFVAHWIHRYRQLILWFDAVGLALFAVIGTQIAFDSGAGLAVSLLLGILTATLGGVFRDLLAGEPTLILRREVYVTAAALGSALWLTLISLNTPSPIATTLAVLAGFSLRAIALHYRLMLPGYTWMASPDKHERRRKQDRAQ